ncbi:TPA: DNA cytosine methyltransferase [Vibrio parahaemolyticus]|nr:DNA cytosine methyltransferase [Vibrio parahaemolyticus]
MKFLAHYAEASCNNPKSGGGAGCCFGKTGLVEWATLDAQYFGVPQRRRRVFAFADFGDWTDRQPILSNSEGLSGDFKSSRTTRENFTNSSAKGPKNGSHWDSIDNPHPTLNQSNNAGGIALSNQELFSQRGAGLVPFDMTGFGQYGTGEKASTCKARDYKDATDLVVAIHGTQDPIYSLNVAHTLGRNQGQENAIVSVTPIHDKATRYAGATGKGSGNGLGVGDINDPSPTLTTSEKHAVSYGSIVRRLTPIEGERLQGMPDYHTCIPWRGKPAEECPDGVRYQAIGNSMNVQTMRWLGEQIDTIEM